MTADTGADIIVADAHEPYGVAGIFGQSFERDVGIRRVRISLHDEALQFSSCDELEGHRHVLLDETVHLALDFLFLLSVGLMVEYITYLAFLTLNVRIARAFTAKHTYHELVEQMFCRVCGGELFFVVFVKIHIVEG